MVRSPEAHARITSIDTSGALATPGVEAVFTGDDLRDSWAAPMPCAWAVTEDMKNPEHLPVAVGKANYQGDIVAVVVANSRYAARDGADAVVVDYEPLPAVVDLEDAASDRVVIHEDAGTQQVVHVDADPRSARGRAGVRSRRRTRCTSGTSSNA